MADTLGELLSVKEWAVAHAAQVAYAAAATSQETPPVPAPDVAYLAYRFARVHAIDGALLVRVLRNGDALPGALGTGDFRIFIGTSETLQIPYKGSLAIMGAGVLTQGSVVWGR